MISPTCIKCCEELNEPGALLIGPPVESGMVAKYHLCSKCFTDFGKLFLEKVFGK